MNRTPYAGRSLVFPALSLLLAAAPLPIGATEIQIAWTGTIGDVWSFSANALPAGIVHGAPITGSLAYDPERYARMSTLFGNVFSGNKFSYGDGLRQDARLGPWTWSIVGGDLTLFATYGSVAPPAQGLDVFSTSDNSAYQQFPQYAGSFEYGIVLYDNVEPLELFDSYGLDNATPALDQFTSGNGFLSSRHWDGNGNIDDGYYVTFDIAGVSLVQAQVPAPPTAAAIVWGLIALGALRGKSMMRRNPKQASGPRS